MFSDGRCDGRVHEHREVGGVMSHEQEKKSRFVLQTVGGVKSYKRQEKDELKIETTEGGGHVLQMMRRAGGQRAGLEGSGG